MGSRSVGGARGLGEAAEDQLQLAGIAGDVADRENARPLRRHGRGIHRNAMAIGREIPAGDGGEVLGQTEEAQQRVARQALRRRSSGVAEKHPFETAVLSSSPSSIRGAAMIMRPLARQRSKAATRGRRGTECRPPMHQRHRGGDVGEEHRPVGGRNRRLRRSPPACRESAPHVRTE